MLFLCAFQAADLATKFATPASVTSIGSGAFYGCSGLTSIVIPNSVSTIEGGAFKDCSGLTSIYFLNPIPSTAVYCFDDTHYQNSTLYVPQEALETYRTAEMWKEFQNIIAIDPTGVTNVNTMGNNTERLYYDINGADSMPR